MRVRPKQACNCFEEGLQPTQMCMPDPNVLAPLTWHQHLLPSLPATTATIPAQMTANWSSATTARSAARRCPALCCATQASAAVPTPSGSRLQPSESVHCRRPSVGALGWEKGLVGADGSTGGARHAAAALPSYTASCLSGSLVSVGSGLTRLPMRTLPTQCCPCCGVSEVLLFPRKALDRERYRNASPGGPSNCAASMAWWWVGGRRRCCARWPARRAVVPPALQIVVARIEASP